MIKVRTFFIFKIKEDYSKLTKNNPYLLFRMLSYIYHLDKEEFKEGADLFYKIVENVKPKELNHQILMKHQSDYFYTMYRSIHQIHDFYKNEDSKLEVHNHYLLLKSSIVKPLFLEDLQSLPDLFLCDFENIDYFWLEKLPV